VTRVHYASKDEQSKPSGGAFTACNRFLWGVSATSAWGGVTCRSCLKRRQPAPTREADPTPTPAEPVETKR
jgi:hypothetical protein